MALSSALHFVLALISVVMGHPTCAACEWPQFSLSMQWSHVDRSANSSKKNPLNQQQALDMTHNKLDDYYNVAECAKISAQNLAGPRLLGMQNESPLCSITQPILSLSIQPATTFLGGQNDTYAKSLTTQPTPINGDREPTDTISTGLTPTVSLTATTASLNQTSSIVPPPPSWVYDKETYLSSSPHTVHAAPTILSSTNIDEPSENPPYNLQMSPGDAEGYDQGLFGISYTPYRSDQKCKSQLEIKDDFRRLGGSYSLVRIYGTDCDQVNKVYSAAKSTGLKLFLGIWDLASLQEEALKIISAIYGDWGVVHTISVGNELVNRGHATPKQVVDALRLVRPLFRSAGYQGPVVTVDVFNVAESHPQLCEASDYCAMNAHPFFDSTVSAPQAGEWLLNTTRRIRSALANSDVMVTETGWPTEGLPNGLAVPGIHNQRVALASIKDAFSANPSHIVLFSAFNDLWKQKETSTFNAEQYWGVDGAVSNCDLKMGT